VIDLFGDDPPAPSQNRASTTEPAIAARPPPQKAPVAAPLKQNRPGDSLLGLDFFGASQSAPPARPASAASGVTSPGGSNPRSDLKQSILSLYASAPKPAPVQQQPASNAFGGFASPPVQSPTASSQSFGGLNDAFGGLNFSSPPPQQQQQQQQQQPPKPTAFANLTSPASRSSSLSGGSFFDTKSAAPAKQPAPPAPRPQPSFGDFGDFTSAPAPAPAATKAPTPSSSGMGDLFDLSAPAPSKPTSSTPSAFNLSTPAPKPAVAPVQAASGLDNMDAWGSTNAWGAPDPAPAPAPAPSAPTSTYKAPATTSVSNNDDEFGGWGSNEGTSSTSKPAVSQDDEFGGWSSAPAPTTTSKAAGSTSDDLFGNVWG